MGQLPGKEKSAEDPSHTLVDGGNLVPHGVYSATQDYSHQIVRHLITHRRLAPFYKGVDDEEHYKDAVANTECPICFLYQPSPLNMSRCCEQPICTECFVQIKRADPTHTNPPSSEPAACPFCMTEDFGIIYVPPKPKQPSGGDGTDMPTGPAPARRRKSFGPTDPEVVTIDMIRPDWAQKLQHAQAAIARRANRRIIMRQVGDRLIPIGVTSGRAAEMLEGMSGTLGSGSSGPGGAIILQENERWLSTSQRAALAAQAALHSGDGAATGGAGEASSTSRREGSGGGVSGNSSDDRRRERRRHNQDLSEYLRTLGGGPDMEEIMLMEAMRLSLLEHEEDERRRTAATESTSNAPVTAAAPASVSETVISTHTSSTSAHPPPPVPEPIPVPSPAPAPAALPSVNTRSELQRSTPASIPASVGKDQSRALEEAMQDLMASPATSAAASVAISPATATARPAALISTDSRDGATPTQSSFSVPRATGSSSLATTSAAAAAAAAAASSSFSAVGPLDESASGEVNSSAAPPSPASAIPTYPVSPSRLQPPSITTTSTSGTTLSKDAVSSSFRAGIESTQGGLSTASPWVSFQDDSGIPPTPVSERSMGDLGAQGSSR